MLILLLWLQSYGGEDLEEAGTGRPLPSHLDAFVPSEIDSEQREACVRDRESAREVVNCADSSLLKDALGDSVLALGRSVVDIPLPWEQESMSLVFGEDDSVTKLLAGLPKHIPVPAVSSSNIQPSDLVAEPPAKRARQMPESGECFRVAISSRAYDSYEEKEEAQWRRALEKWLVILTECPGSSYIGETVAIQKTDDAIETLRELFGRKSGSTDMKRGSALMGYLSWGRKECRGGDLLPFKSSHLDGYLKHLKSEKRPAGAFTSFQECVNFAIHVVGIAVDESVIGPKQSTVWSHWSKGVIGQAQLTKAERKQATVLLVAYVAALERLLEDESVNSFDRYACGAILFGIFSRSRVSDLRKTFSWFLDFSELASGGEGFIECKTRDHKTANAVAHTGFSMPLVAPARGVTSSAWAVTWAKVAEDVGSKVLRILTVPGESSEDASDDLSAGQADGQDDSPPASLLHRTCSNLHSPPEDAHPAEKLACIMLQWNTRFSQEEMQTLLDMLPQKHQTRARGSCDDQSNQFLCGAYAHGPMTGCKNLTQDMPWCTAVLCKHVRDNAPGFCFSAVGYLCNVRAEAHRDLHNEPGTKNLVMATHACAGGGLWLEEARGPIAMVVEKTQRAGRFHDLAVGVAKVQKGSITFGVYHEPEEFVARALSVQHPCHLESLLPSELVEAIRANHSKDVATLGRERTEMLKKWLARAEELETAESQFKGSFSSHRRQVLCNKRLLLMKEMLDSVGHEDEDLISDLSNGFDLTGPLPRSNAFKNKYRPAAVAEETLRKSAGLVRGQVLASVKSSGDEIVDQGVLAATEKELAKGFIEGPVSASDIPSDGTVTHRFGVIQGETEEGPKVRPIDNYLSSLVNSVVSQSEQVPVHTLDVVAGMLAMWLHLSPLKSLRAGLVCKCWDLSAAYKQLPLSDKSFEKDSFFVIFCPRTRKHVIYKQRVMPFGAKASVTAFIRCAFGIWRLGVKMFALVWSFYFDDFLSACKPEERRHVEVVISTLFRLLGWDLSLDKLLPYDVCCKVLGIKIDMAEARLGLFKLANTEKRVLELTAALDEVLLAGRLSHSDCERLRGRLQFASGQLFGRRAKVALHQLSRHHGGRLSEVTSEACRFLRRLVSSNQSRSISRQLGNVVHVYVDASFSDEGKLCGIGGMAYDHKGSLLQWFGENLDASLVSQVMTSFERVKGKNVVVFTDNEGVHGAFVKCWTVSQFASHVIDAVCEIEENLGFMIWAVLRVLARLGGAASADAWSRLRHVPGRSLSFLHQRSPDFHSRCVVSGSASALSFGSPTLAEYPPVFCDRFLAAASSASGRPLALLNALGWAFDSEGDKRLELQETFVALGIQVNLADLHRGSFVLANKPGLRFLSKAVSALAAKDSTSDQVQKLCSLAQRLLGETPPSRFDLSVHRPPWLIFTDGAYEQGKATARVVWYDPDGERAHTAGIDVPLSLIELWQRMAGAQIISQVEAWAFLVARRSLPPSLLQRQTIAWIDNEAARMSLIKGSSYSASMRDISRLYHQLT
ncbi:unnamed protein product [Symbiodinium sp. CCMP2592]|nr:unnamed protein product [Symbiodinium sp. CCMP2592]